MRPIVESRVDHYLTILLVFLVPLLFKYLSRGLDGRHRKHGTVGDQPLGETLVHV